MRIGIDIVDIDRVETALKRTPRMLHRVFSEEERAYCLAKADPYPSLAVRFAAKEALRKIDISLCRGIKFSDVGVSLQAGGRPELVLSDVAAAKMAALGINRWEISLAHARNQAIAAIIAYGE